MKQEITIHSNQHQIDKIEQMLTNIELSKWKEKTDKLAWDCKCSMVLVETYRGHYDIWPVSQHKGQAIYLARFIKEDKHNAD